MKKTKRLLCVVLAFVLSFACVGSAFAAVEASDYLSFYSADCYYDGNGSVWVYFDVEGVGYVPYLGVLSINLQEQVPGSGDWDTVMYVSNFTDESLLSENDDFHYGSVEYDKAVEGYLYRAIVCFWGGEAEVGDTRYYTTDTIVATP